MAFMDEILRFAGSFAVIVVINLMLSGDNAIVIALAARNVPAHLQRRAIAFGTVGAVVVRCAMTLAVVWLLAIPGLLFMGGAALIWIGYKLLLPEEQDEHGAIAKPRGIWGAVRTIVIADMVMGGDNVRGVAGAAPCAKDARAARLRAAGARARDQCRRGAGARRPGDFAH